MKNRLSNESNDQKMGGGSVYSMNEGDYNIVKNEPQYEEQGNIIFIN
jgi:hypothetical protein